MESELYKVTKKDLPKLQALLNKCFASDPLYETLIPNEDIRKKLLPATWRNSTKTATFLPTARI